MSDFPGPSYINVPAWAVKSDRATSAIVVIEANAGAAFSAAVEMLTMREYDGARRYENYTAATRLEVESSIRSIEQVGVVSRKIDGRDESPGAFKTVA